MTDVGTPGWATRAGRAIVAVLPQWVVARLVVLGALALAHLVVDRAHPSGATAARVHQGLLGWDAGWYEAIARVGYGPLGHQSLRFFPLFPLVGRALAYLPGVSAGAALVVVANLSALVATALLRVLVVRESGDQRWADRSVWLFSLAPPAFVLVMGYAEGLLLVLAVGCFLAIRRGSGRGWAGAAGAAGPAWLWAAVLGAAAGLTRPVGVLLAVPVAIEAARRWRATGAGERALAVVATLAPVAGAGAFLAWSAGVYGDGLLPLRVQTQAGHHGGLSDPFRTLAHDVTGVAHHHFGTALHVPWVALVVALVVVCWWRLPAPYGAFATVVLVVALTGTNLDSFERYALGAFPLVVAAASLTAGRRVERSVLVLAAAGLAGYALLTFLNLSVP
ncbi:MAG TPA: hypothetical protein VHX40_08825 [Acidimicrobiales bacterium]|nr:hypothetical protein [Acidimicrobiales bacterium]